MKLKVASFAFHHNRKKYLDKLKRGRIAVLVITSHGRPAYEIRRAKKEKR